MGHKLHYEPLYAKEGIALLKNIVRERSLRDSMEESISKRKIPGFHTRVAPFYETGLALEDYVKNNLRLTPHADFLMQPWGNSKGSPMDAIHAYDLVKHLYDELKGVCILYSLDENILEGEWGTREAEEGTHPHAISDSRFFNLANNAPVPQEDKLKAMELYYNFEKYQAEAHEMLQQTEQLIKDKLPDLAPQIKAFAHYAETQLLTKDAIKFNNLLHVSLTDGKVYDIYPGVYQVNAVSLNAAGFFPDYIIIGLSALELWAMIESADNQQDGVTQFLKILSDSTKQAMLKLLKERPLYGSQLAEKLQCTSANISQHISALMQLELVQLQKEGNRIYCHLNREKIRYYLEAAKDVFT